MKGPDHAFQRSDVLCKRDTRGHCLENISPYYSEKRLSRAIMTRNVFG